MGDRRGKQAETRSGRRACEFARDNLPREVQAELANAEPEEALRRAFLKTDEEKKHAYALFEQVVENGEFLTQDEVFCRRWKNVGGAIYANITLQLNRIGSHKFNGQFLRSII